MWKTQTEPSQGNSGRGFKGFRKCGWETRTQWKPQRVQRQSMASADTGYNAITVKARDMLKEDIARTGKQDTENGSSLLGRVTPSKWGTCWQRRQCGCETPTPTDMLPRDTQDTENGSTLLGRVTPSEWRTCWQRRQCGCETPTPRDMLPRDTQDMARQDTEKAGKCRSNWLITKTGNPDKVKPGNCSQGIETVGPNSVISDHKLLAVISRVPTQNRQFNYLVIGVHRQ
jgi:hypothetical protein